MMQVKKVILLVMVLLKRIVSQVRDFILNLKARDITFNFAFVVVNNCRTE